MRYHAMMLDSEGTIRGIRSLSHEDDLAAINAARDVLEQSQSFEAIEIWREGRRIARISSR